MLHERRGAGNSRTTGKPAHERRYVKLLRERKFVEPHLAGKLRRCGGAVELQIGGENGTNALRVKNAHAVALKREIEGSGFSKSDRALRGECASANLRLELPDINPFASELKYRVPILKPNRAALGEKGRIDDANLSLHARREGAHAPFGRDVDFNSAGALHGRSKTLQCGKIHGAIDGQTCRGAAVFHWNAPLNLEVSAGARQLG